MNVSCPSYKWKPDGSRKRYHETSRPLFCAREGFVDEVVNMTDLRKYLVAFAGAAYQNPRSICPQHQMMLPRIIRG